MKKLVAFLAIVALLILGGGEVFGKKIAVIVNAQIPSKIRFVNVETQTIEGELDIGSIYQRGAYGVAISPDNNAFITLDNDFGKLLAVDIQNRHIITDADTGSNPMAVRVSPDGRIFVDGFYENLIYEYEFKNKQLMKVNSYPTGEGPFDMAVINGRLYVSNWLGGSISVINLQTGESQVVTGIYQPVGIDVCGGNVFVVGMSYVNQSLDGLLIKIDDATRSITSSWKVGLRVQRAIAVKSDCKTAFVADYDNHAVLSVNLETGVATKIFSIYYPGSVDLTSDEKILVAVSFNAASGVENLFFWDTVNNQLLGTMTIPGQPISFGKFIAEVPDDPPEEVTVTVAKTGDAQGKGQVLVNGNALSCNTKGVCAAVSAYTGDEIALTAQIAPSDGVFSGWGEGCSSVANGVCKIKLAGNISIAANFLKPAKLTRSPTSLNFGSVAMGVASVIKAVTVKNAGSASLIVGSVDVVGTNSSDFSVASNSCFTPLTKGATCAIEVRVTAGDYGNRNAQLDISSNDPAGVKSVKLQANCKPPAIAVPGSISFPKTTVGSSAVKALTIKNTGVSELTIAEVEATAQFEVSGACPSLQKNETCQLSVSFSPASTGTRTGTLRIYSNDPARNLRSLSLRGTGAPL